MPNMKFFISLNKRQISGGMIPENWIFTVVIMVGRRPPSPLIRASAQRIEEAAVQVREFNQQNQNNLGPLELAFMS
jgi:hypothetical protein